MNRDDILRMAREAGDVRCDCCLPEPEPYEMQQFLERFAALVAAHNRKPLTDAEIDGIANHLDETAIGWSTHEFARAIEQAHGIGIKE